MTRDWTHWSPSTALILTGVFQPLFILLLPGQNSSHRTLAVFVIWERRNRTDNFMRHFSSLHHVPLWSKTFRVVVVSSSFFTTKCMLLQHWCVSVDLCSLGSWKTVDAFILCLASSPANDITGTRPAQISFSADFPHTFSQKKESFLCFIPLPRVQLPHFGMLSVWQPITCTASLRQHGQLPFCTFTGSCVLLQWRAPLHLKDPKGTRGHVFLLYCPPQSLSGLLMVTPKTVASVCPAADNAGTYFMGLPLCRYFGTPRGVKLPQLDKSFDKGQRHKPPCTSSKLTCIKMTTCGMSIFTFSLLPYHIESYPLICMK